MWILDSKKVEGQITFVVNDPAPEIKERKCVVVCAVDKVHQVGYVMLGALLCSVPTCLFMALAISVGEIRLWSGRRGRRDLNASCHAVISSAAY